LSESQLEDSLILGIIFRLTKCTQTVVLQQDGSIKS